MKSQSYQFPENARAALAIAGIGPFVEHIDRLEKLFPEYEEDDRDAFDMYRILVYLFSCFVKAGGEKVLYAHQDIQIQLKLGKNAVDARLKRLKDDGLIETVIDTDDKDRRRRLLVPTAETVRRFNQVGLHMYWACRHFVEKAHQYCSDLPGYTPEEEFLDPLPNGLSTAAGSQKG